MAAGLHKYGRKFRQETNRFSCASIADVHLRMMAPTLTTLLAVVIQDIVKAKAPASVAALCFKVFVLYLYRFVLYLLNFV